MAYWLNRIPPCDETTITKSSGQLAIKDVGNYLQFVSSNTLVGAATSIDLTGLDISTDGMYRIDVYQVGPANNNSVYCYFNADTTATNYYSQSCDAVGAAAGASLSNAPVAGGTTANKNSHHVIWIYHIGGYAAFMVHQIRDIGTSVAIHLYYGLKTSATVANITQVTLTCSVANGFGIGSWYKLYKVA